MIEFPPPRRPFLEGIRATAPVQLGSFPFGMIVGVTAVTSGLDVVSGQGMSLIMFAGASQLVAMQLMREGAPTLVVIASACIVNLRFLMYSAALAPHYRPFSMGVRLLLAHLITDQGFAITMNRYGPAWDDAAKRAFALGSGLLMWAAWQASTLLGILLGARLSKEWSFEFAVPLTFLALAVPALRDGPLVAAFVVSGVIAVAGYALPLNLGLVGAATAGILTGLTVEARRP